MDCCPQDADNWTDVILTEGSEPTISYRTGMAVYEESLRKGSFVGRGWNAAGLVNFYDGRINPDEHPMPQAFWLEVDGQLLATDWKWIGCEEIPAAAGERHVVIALEHAVRPVSVKVHTKLDGTARGGVVVAIQKELGLPVKLVGLGEGAADLVVFDPTEFADALLAP